MALYRPNYWNNYPEPFYPGWQNEPIPGWGVRPVMAGPARVGVGQAGFKEADAAPAGALRWLPWIVGAGILLAMGAVAVDAWAQGGG